MTFFDTDMPIIGFPATRQLWKPAPMATALATRTRADWETQARSLRPDGRAIIGGQRRAANSGRTFDAVSPIDGRVLGSVARCEARGRQCRGGRRARHFRGGRVAARRTQGAQARAVAAERVDSRRSRQSRAARNPRCRQADTRFAHCRCAFGGRLHRLLRRVCRQAVRRGRPYRTQRSGTGPPRAPRAWLRRSCRGTIR